MKKAYGSNVKIKTMNDINQPVGITIINNKVGIYISEEKLKIIVINDKGVAKTLKAYFEKTKEFVAFIRNRMK